MKKIFSLLLSFCVVFFCACTGGTGTEGASTPTTEPVQTTVPVVLSDEEIYSAFIDQLTKSLHKIIGDDTYLDGFDSKEGMIGIYEIASLHKKDMLDKMGYTVKDINNDGTLELLICEVDELTEESRKGTRILCAYTVFENKMSLLLEGHNRNAYYLLEDVTFYNNGTGGSECNGFGVYQMEKGSNQLTCVDFYFTDTDENNNKLFLHNQTGDWDVSKSEPFDGNEEAFWANMSELETGIQSMDLTAFEAFEAFVG